MHNVDEMIKDILQSNEENRLAIFIGAGVSVNSGYKLWWQIVDTFNESKKYINNIDADGRDRDYTDREILMIPQFAYDSDRELYFKILEEEFNNLPEETNPIVDMLLRLKPNHLITTNYDRLIEQSLDKLNIYGNTVHSDYSKYSKIINNKGFITASKPHYLINTEINFQRQTKHLEFQEVQAYNPA